MSAPIIDLFGPLPPDGPRESRVAGIRQTPVRAHLRRVNGAPLPTGPERRGAALARHGEKEAVRAALVYVRARLLELYRARGASNPDASVSADDAADILDQWPQCPPEIRAMKRQAWRGTLFTGGAWVKTGDRIVSKRPDMNGHDYPTWRPTT